MYPFDHTGLAPSNLILNEKVPITISNGINAYIIVPEAAPFFANSLVITNENGDTLIPGQDYFLTHPWEQASNVTNAPINGSITLTKDYNVGIYTLNYRTIGGTFVENKTNTITNGLTVTAEEFLNIDWDTAPTAFPPSPHTQELSSINGLQQIVKSIYEVAQALREPNESVVYDDIKDIAYMDIASTFAPMIDMVEAFNANSKEISNLLVTVLNKQNPDKEISEELNDLNHYNETMIGGLKIVTGKYVVSSSLLPTIINFNKVFPNKCLYADVKIHCNENNIITEDKITTSRPTKTGIKVKIILEKNIKTINKPRVISYFAIGV